jgi:hypothetical protein
VDSLLKSIGSPLRAKDPVEEIAQEVFDWQTCSKAIGQKLPDGSQERFAPDDPRFGAQVLEEGDALGNALYRLGGEPRLGFRSTMGFHALNNEGALRAAVSERVQALRTELAGQVPDEAQLERFVEGAVKWISGAGSRPGREQGRLDPSDPAINELLQLTDRAPLTSETLYRGLRGSSHVEQVKPGETFDVDARSFTNDYQTAREFSTGAYIKLVGEKRALNLSPLTVQPEYLVAGTFRLKSITEDPQTRRRIYEVEQVLPGSAHTGPAE